MIYSLTTGVLIFVKLHCVLKDLSFIKENWFLFFCLTVYMISSLVSTNVTSALKVFLNDMRYINPRFTYLLTYFTYTH